jgi:hypothetical protein
MAFAHRETRRACLFLRTVSAILSDSPIVLGGATLARVSGFFLRSGNVKVPGPNQRAGTVPKHRIRAARTELNLP